MQRGIDDKINQNESDRIWGRRCHFHLVDIGKDKLSFRIDLEFKNYVTLLTCIVKDMKVFANPSFATSPREEDTEMDKKIRSLVNSILKNASVPDADKDVPTSSTPTFVIIHSIHLDLQKQLELY